jgi:hypothetical protein
MFAEFERLADRFRRARTPERLPREWVSPYRLLFGAIYSIGTAEKSIAGDPPALDDIPLDLSASLDAAVHHQEDLPWFRVWHASYMLTSAIFRVAAAAEKTCSLAVPELERREDLWREARQADSRLSMKLPRARVLLGQMPKRRETRSRFLQAQRGAFPVSQTVALPLVCAFAQTDRDKHVPYSPGKELAFEHALATLALREACDLWDDAVDAERGGATSTA